MKNRIWIVVFFFATFLLALPLRDSRDDGFHSSELVLHSIEETNYTISVYTDDNGIITKPANIGYSIILKDKNADGDVVQERYYLCKKIKTFEKLSMMNLSAIEKVLIPEEQWGKHYGLKREYNNIGECISYTYLDAKGNPMDISSGLSTVKQEFDEYHRRVKEMYYSAKGEKTTNISKIYGQAFTYYSSDEAARGEVTKNEKNISWLIETVSSLDQEGNLINSASGYAITRRFYGADNRTCHEQFFDCSGKPAANQLGAYGQDYTYDELGRQMSCTYLDSDYRPVNCNKGYSKIVRSFFKNNSTKAEKYFTSDGLPAVLSHGESEIVHKMASVQYINAQGKRILVLDNFLRGNPMLVIFVTLMIWLISSLLDKKGNILLICCYIVFILYMTLFCREIADEAIKLNFFKTFMDFFKRYAVRIQIIENIYLFIPFGICCGKFVGKKKVILFGFIFSLAIEMTQYFGHLGCAEIMDVFSNGLGAFVGVTMCCEKTLCRTK